MPVTERDYGTVGYVISGRAELDLEGQTVRLEPGDSWLGQPVPGTLTAYWSASPVVEATAPPAQAI